MTQSFKEIRCVLLCKYATKGQCCFPEIRKKNIDVTSLLSAIPLQADQKKYKVADCCQKGI